MIKEKHLWKNCEFCGNKHTGTCSPESLKKALEKAYWCGAYDSIIHSHIQEAAIIKDENGELD
jgi:hypothetical protein